MLTKFQNSKAEVVKKMLCVCFHIGFYMLRVLHFRALKNVICLCDTPTKAYL